MNTNRLDDAIDQTAARMVAVPDDPEMIARIVSALPERSSGLGWLIPQFAALSALAVVAVLWSTRERPEAPALLPSTDVTIVAALADAITPREPGRREPGAREPGAREPGTVRTLEPWNPGTLEPDFDRSLPAITALNVLSVTDVQTNAIALPAPISFASIEVADLKLTAETFTTQKEE
jgi:hypothetical protein